MSKYITDPREMAINPESGVTYEEDNRVETMYHWGAKVLDLCDLPIEEYMKPMTVNINGYTPESGDTGTTKVSVSITVSVVSPDGDVLDKDGNVIGHVEGDGTWKVKWSWNKNFNGSLVSSVSVFDNELNKINIVSTLNGNQGNEAVSTISSVTGTSTVSSIGDCKIGLTEETATGSTATIEDTENKKEYNIVIKAASGGEPFADGDVYYSFIPKSLEPQFGEMDKIVMSEAQGDGVDFKFVTEVSEEYTEEAEKFDDGEAPYDGDDAEEIWDDFVEEYENENRYVLRIYIPKETEDQYEYLLYNDNAGILVSAQLTKTGIEKTYESIEYSEYVNEDDSYLYDDVGNREFTLRFIINKK